MSNITNIAIIDDDDAVREALHELLESCGYKSVQFKSAVDFLVAGDRFAFSCILSDVKMPGMDGIQMLAALNKELSRPPIIFITSLSEGWIRHAATLGGASAFLSKPVEAGQLIKILEDAVIGSSE